MEAGLIIGNQIIIMFIILIIGAFCYLKGIITKDGTKQLSSFALNIINPVLIFMSYQSKYDKTLVHELVDLSLQAHSTASGFHIILSRW